MIWVCPADGWLIVDEKWMPGNDLTCEWCKRVYAQEFGAAWSDEAD
jgi:hypothetical protein